jgi:hypothetical protein
MSAPTLSDAAACRFITLYAKPSATTCPDFEAFVWTKATPVPAIDVEYVANAIHVANAAGRAFYLFFKHKAARDGMKAALARAGVHATQAVLQ